MSAQLPFLPALPVLAEGPLGIFDALSQVILWITMVSVGGWVYETIVCSIQERHLVKRGFLCGPYCPIYGVGAVTNYLLVGWLPNPVAVFLAGAILATVLEYLTGWALETLFHERWWDYTGWFLNIHGRVCLAGFLVFGFFTLLIVYVLQPIIMGGVATLSLSGRLLCGSTFWLVYALDLYVSSQLSSKERRGGRDMANELVRALRASRPTMADVRAEARTTVEESRNLVRDRMRWLR